MQIPQATVRSLALRPIGLEDEEEEEEDASGELQLEAEAANQQRLQQQQQEQLARQQTSGDGRSLEASFWDKGMASAAGGENKSSRHVGQGELFWDADGPSDASGSKAAGLWSRFTSLFKRRHNRVVVISGKRKLQPSNSAAIFLVSAEGAGS